MKNGKRVVITGIGIIGPGGIGKKKLWETLKSGRSVIKRISAFNTSGMPYKLAGEITNFNACNILGKKGLRNLTRGAKFALAASKLALEDAGLAVPVPEKVTDSYGVSLGSVTGSVQSMVGFDRQILKDGPRSVNPADFPNTAFNAIASQISIRFNIKGFCTSISTSIASGLDAMFYADNMIRNQGYSVCLAGGAEELTSETYTGLSKLRCLARKSPGKKREMSCPYDKRRNGIIFSEGSCMLILEELKHALKRKTKIYAELKGRGFSIDIKAAMARAILADGATEAIKQAIFEFGYPRRNIDYIVGSANSSQRFDAIEVRSIKNVFSGKSKCVPVSSIKSIIGESFAAGGVFNVAAAVSSLLGSFIPPTINYSVPDKLCDLNIVANKAVSKRLNNILVNSFSPRGQNASMVIGRCDA